MSLIAAEVIQHSGRGCSVVASPLQKESSMMRLALTPNAEKRARMDRQIENRGGQISVSGRRN
jgi:hypothetical protein